MTKVTSVDELVASQIGEAIQNVFDGVFAAKEDITDPGPSGYDFAKEDQTRQLMKEAAEYDEQGGPTFDPDGDYLCGTCLFRMLLDSGVSNACWIVQGPISMDTGSCRKYKRGTPEPEKSPLKMAEKYSQVDAGYAERPEAKGFGCFPRCGHASIAEGQDRDGRPTWCGQFGVHVQPKACCFFEGGKDLVLPKVAS
jgi:hypothetical protein